MRSCQYEFIFTILPQVLNTLLPNTIYPMLTIVLYRLLPQVFDSNGELIFSFGTNGEGNGQFNAPTGVAVDGQVNFLRFHILL